MSEEKEYEIQVKSTTYRTYLIDANNPQDAEEQLWDELSMQNCGDGVDQLTNAWLEGAEINSIETT